MTGPEVFILVYVKYAALLRSETRVIELANGELKFLVNLTDFGVLHFPLGLSVIQKGNMMFCTQSTYYSRILNQFGMALTRSDVTFWVKNINYLILESVESDAGGSEDISYPYRSFIDSLLHLNPHPTSDLTLRFQ